MKIWKVLPVVALLLVAACRTAPIYNVESAELGAPPNATMAQVEQAIKTAGAGLGWQMIPNGPGDITGRLMLRSHVAVVDVAYDTKTFSINYEDSTNLKYDADGTIHKNYNSWVKNLQHAIQVQATAIPTS